MTLVLAFSALQARSATSPTEAGSELALAASGSRIWKLSEVGQDFWQISDDDRPPWQDHPSRDPAARWQPLAPASTDALDDVIGESETVWLRLPLRVAPELRGGLFALELDLAGAVEVYLGARLIGSSGRIDRRGPLGEPAAFRRAGSLQLFELGRGERQDLWVRYSQRPLARMRWGAPSSGFELVVGEQAAMRQRTDRLHRTIVAMQMGFVGAYGAQAFLHLVLFFFYRRERSQLHFAVFALSVALLVFLQFEALLVTEPATEARVSLWWQTSLVLAFLALLRFAYSLTRDRTPRLFWLFGVVGASLILVRILRPEVNVFVDFWWFPLLALGESVRALAKAMAERRRGALILATGVAIIAGAVVLQLLITLGFLPAPMGEIAPVPYVGVLGLTLSMSIYLAKSFADTNRELQARLAQVQELSQRTLRQELEAKDREMATRLLEADNRRKTEELHSAREFLLSLLPKELPDFPGFQVAAEMRTAVEVGGDYWDWRIRDDALLVAIGDATGHDARAGAMVSIVKGLFTSWDGQGDPGVFMGNANATLRAMKLRSILMSFTVLRIDQGTVLLSSGGMPPALVYRARPGAVEEIAIEEMPLGALHRGPYPSRSIPLEPGDCLLLTSDGLPELQAPSRGDSTEDGEMLGYRRVREAMTRAGRRSTAQATVQEILALVDEWSRGEPPSDDVIVLAVRRIA